MKDQTRETGRNGAPPFSAGVETRFHIALALTAKPSPAREAPNVDSSSASSLARSALRLALMLLIVGLGEVEKPTAPSLKLTVSVVSGPDAGVPSAVVKRVKGVHPGGENERPDALLFAEPSVSQA